MWEVILGSLLLFGYACFMPKSFDRLRNRFLKSIKFGECRHADDSDDSKVHTRRRYD